MDNLPLNIEQQAHSLTPDQLLTLLKVEIFPQDGASSLILYLSETRNVVFNNITYSSAAFSLVGAGLDASGEKTRPRLQLPNQQGMFSVFAQNGDLEGARVDRYRVHPDDEGSSNQAVKHSWYVSRVEIVTQAMIVLELAALTDGAKVVMPYRKFALPEFKSVRL